MFLWTRVYNEYMTSTNTTAATFDQGDVVNYEDVYNFETYVVVRYNESDSWNPYTLCNTRTLEIIHSDMRQKGWNLA